MLTALVFVVFAQVVTPPQNITVQSNVTLVAPPMDQAQVAEAGVTTSQAVLTTVIAPPPIQWTNELLGLPPIWNTTPDNLSWDNSAIRTLAGLIQNVALALLSLAILARGLGIMLRRETWEGMGRLFFAVIAVFGNLVWWQWGIQLNNAMTASIAAPALPSLIKPHLVTAIDPGTAVGTVVLLLVYAIVALMLLFSLLFRLGVIDILIACGSLALMMYSTEQTQYIANHYSRVAVAVLFSQVLIVICLQVASVLTTLGSGGALGTLLSLAVLWLARSAPQAILAGSASSNGNRWGGAVVRMIMRRIGK